MMWSLLIKQERLQTLKENTINEEAMKEIKINAVTKEETKINTATMRETKVNAVMMTKEEYQRHLHSASWKELREKALERVHHTCQQCGCKRGLRVSHFDWSNVGTEKELNDVEVLCYFCHCDKFRIKYEKDGRTFAQKKQLARVRKWKRKNGSTP